MRRTRPINRRQWLAASLATAAAPVAAFCRELPSRTLRLWASGDPHVGTDLWEGRGSKRTRRKGSRESLAEAIRQSESPAGFDWDVALCVGDFSGNQDIPDDDEGREIVRQFGAMARHRRAQFYTLAGNHDASPGYAWYRKWLDPLGQHAADSGVDPRHMPAPPSGTWERYWLRLGNLLWLVMSDRNDYAPPVGRMVDGHGKGGRPAGAVTTETFAWWKQMVEENRDAVILCAHHHMLRDTTVASGYGEGCGTLDAAGNRVGHYHGYFPDDGPHNNGASHLYWLVDEQQQPPRPTPDSQAFERHLAGRPGAIDLWIGGHTHAPPDDVVNGRSHVERKYGATFVNCAALTRYHAASHSIPMSRLLTFVEGRREVRIQCYLHTNRHAPQGWYPQAERTAILGKPFSLG